MTAEGSSWILTETGIERARGPSTALFPAHDRHVPRGPNTRPPNGESIPSNTRVPHAAGPASPPNDMLYHERPINRAMIADIFTTSKCAKLSSRGAAAYPSIDRLPSFRRSRVHAEDQQWGQMGSDSSPLGELLSCPSHHLYLSTFFLFGCFDSADLSFASSRTR